MAHSQVTEEATQGAASSQCQLAVIFVGSLVKVILLLSELLLTITTEQTGGVVSTFTGICLSETDFAPLTARIVSQVGPSSIKSPPINTLPSYVPTERKANTPCGFSRVPSEARYSRTPDSGSTMPSTFTWIRWAMRCSPFSKASGLFNRASVMLGGVASKRTPFVRHFLSFWSRSQTETTPKNMVLW